jgi:opacity protein-like surface antigen
MKRLVTLTGISLLFLSSLAWAGINAVDGFYIGAEVGKFSNERVPGSASAATFFGAMNGSELFYGRPFVGYRINDNVAIESGYTSFRGESNAGNETWGPDHYYFYTIDVAGKFIYPFANGFSVYGKGGLAYAHQDVYNKVLASDTMPVVDSKVDKVLPLIGAGISYNFTPHIAMDLIGTHIHGSGIINDINTIGLSAAYNFG